MSVNKVILLGNVGKDPDIRHLDSGVAVASFPLATSENYTAKNGEKVSTTEWHNIVMWRGLAEIAEKYVKKGRQLFIEGKIRTRSWDDKDGNKRYITEIVADNMMLLGGRDSSQNGGADFKKSEEKLDTTDDFDVDQGADDDLPF